MRFIMSLLQRIAPPRHAQEESTDPMTIALNATLMDLRRVASDLQETNRAFAEKVIILKGNK